MLNRTVFGLFEVIGVELEYMIVDRQTLRVMPIADKVLFAAAGVDGVSDYYNGPVAWSNELVSHVLEIKTVEPRHDFAGLSGDFFANIIRINSILAEHGAMLLPTAAHPFMNPFTDVVIWPHKNNEIYSLYNRVFDCRGHGWGNLQSTHVNLPFRDDHEFGRLHGAIRVLLPVISALAASSPVLDSRLSCWNCARMEAYLHNQERIPVLMGRLIPERVYTRADYHEQIFAPIIAAMKLFDTDGVTDHHFLNSRGAIARFDRGALEIRVMDIQECPAADVAIVKVVVEIVKALSESKWAPVSEAMDHHEGDLLGIFMEVIRFGGEAVISDRSYLSLFGISDSGITAAELWDHIFSETAGVLGPDERTILGSMLSRGNLSSTIKNALGTPGPDGIFGEGPLLEVYGELANCLAENRLFRP